MHSRTTAIRASFKVGLLLITLWAALTAGGVALGDYIYNFTGGTTGGQNPSASLILSGTKLYGTTESGGSSNDGVVFSINTDFTGFTLLHSFTGGTSDGASAGSSLLLAGSKLYGVTNSGGANGLGAAYSVNLDGSGFTLLHSFAGGSSDGSNPTGSLTLLGSQLYGMTDTGGSANKGVAFSMNLDGSNFSLIHSFTSGTSDGSNVNGVDGLPVTNSLTVSGSTLYGMTLAGGSINAGVAFKMNSDGSGFTILHNFIGGANDGANPHGSLTISGSKIYGMADDNGQFNGGMAFSMNLDGSGFTEIHSFKFATTDGSDPIADLTAFGSTLYGMTWNNGAKGLGVLFSMNDDGTGYQLLENFTSSNHAVEDPFGDVTLSTDGLTIYGMGPGGSNSDGAIFGFPLPSPEPAGAALLAIGAALCASTRRRYSIARKVEG